MSGLIDAILAMDTRLMLLVFLAVLASGAVLGLLCFSRLLHWLLQRFSDATMALLTGFLFGSLVVVWPWKQVLTWYSGSQGQLKPAQQMPVGPDHFLTVTGEDPQLGLCLLLMVLGFGIVWYVERRWGKVGIHPEASG